MKRILSILFIFLTLYSCKKGKQNYVLSPFFDSATTQAERIYDSGYKDQALHFIDSVYLKNEYRLTPMDKIRFIEFDNIIYTRDYHDYDRSIVAADSIIHIIEKYGIPEELAGFYARAYYVKADAYFAKGDYNNAYNNYYIAKKLAKDHADSCSLSYYSYSLGMVLYRQQRYKEAGQYFLSCYNDATGCKDVFVYFYFRQEVLDNIGLCYSNINQYDSALYYYDSALNYIRHNTYKFPNKKERVFIAPQAVIYGNVANVYNAMGKTDTAISLLKTSININIQKGYTNSDAQIAQVKLANIYLKKGDMTDMSKLLGDIKNELDTLPNLQIEMQWNKLMWQYYEHNNQQAKSFYYVLRYNQLNDSLSQSNKAFMATNIDGRIKDIEKQYQINILKKNKVAQSTYLVIAVILVLMAVIIILLVLKGTMRARKNVKILTGLNNQVNEQKQKLEVALKELEIRDKDKTRILRSVAHDVMNPIAAISALTDILISETGQRNDEEVEILNLIKEACTSSLNLSRDILEVAVKINPEDMTREPVNIYALVKNSIELLSFRAVSKKQQIILHGNDEQIVANINKDKMWRVVNNLIINAIKFSHENSVIDVDIYRTKDTITISVADSGVGIPNKNKSKVFDMFTEAKRPGTMGEKPYGLGLSISLQILKAHGGNISFDTEDGKGTTFYITFPQGVNAK